MVEEDRKIERSFSDNKENNSIDCSKETTSSSKSCSNYTYTIEDIDNFFASDNGQEEEHSLEDRRSLA